MMFTPRSLPILEYQPDRPHITRVNTITHNSSRVNLTAFSSSLFAGWSQRQPAGRKNFHHHRRRPRGHRIATADYVQLQLQPPPHPSAPPSHSFPLSSVPLLLCSLLSPPPPPSPHAQLVTPELRPIKRETRARASCWGRGGRGSYHPNSACFSSPSCPPISTSLSFFFFSFPFFSSLFPCSLPLPPGSVSVLFILSCTFSASPTDWQPKSQDTVRTLSHCIVSSPSLGRGRPISSTATTKLLLE
ncbi:hypothetical protein HOY80DRAFT_657625 [Tuber brumale]|nr:hypothetical protein HOY80DRAFT_657625 [Tuber brumale]